MIAATEHKRRPKVLAFLGKYKDINARSDDLAH
jgi:hypothetical protein